jgi:hypothetical protein
MNINILIKDEISIILLWVGFYGLLDQLIHYNSVFPYKNYLYSLFILISLFIKLS